LTEGKKRFETRRLLCSLLCTLVSVVMTQKPSHVGWATSFWCTFLMRKVGKKSHVEWATSFWCTFLMRKVGKKRTLPTLP